MKPIVSVILPVYNTAHLLPEAVRSVRAQRFEALEIVIVNDGSTDDTQEVIDGLGPDVRSFYQENQGPAAARNFALRESVGEVIAMLDADDLWPDGKLAMQLERLQRDEQLQVVGGRTELVSHDGTSLGPERFEGDDRRYSSVNLGACLFRRSAFDRVGFFDEGLRFSEDQDWFLRAREQGLPMLFLKEVTLIYRRHQGNMTLGKNGHDLMLPQVIRRSLQRRRAAAKEASNLSAWSSLDEELT